MKTIHARAARVAMLAASLLVVWLIAASGTDAQETTRGLGGLEVSGGYPAPRGGESTPTPSPRTFGVQDVTSHTIQAFEFEAFDASYVTLTVGTANGARACTDSCFLEAPLMLPAGALVEFIEVEACDDDGFGTVQTTLFSTLSPGATLTAHAVAFTGDAEVPGCDFFVGAPASPLTIDNFNETYVVEIALTGGTVGTRFHAVRVAYSLQISPPPGVATFGDVPTNHLFFQHVEALAGSGITQGCAAGPPVVYCPNDPVTRGQMAAFLARALGLHWAP